MAAPVIPQDGAIINAAYIQEYESEEDSDAENRNEDDGIVMLSYNSDNSSGKIMNISKDCSKDSENDQSKEDVKSVESPAKIQETTCNQVMEKEFADMRIVQLANTIAGDLGMVTKVSLSR